MSFNIYVFTMALIIAAIASDPTPTLQHDEEEQGTNAPRTRQVSFPTEEMEIIPITESSSPKSAQLLEQETTPSQQVLNYFKHILITFKDMQSLYSAVGAVRQALTSMTSGLEGIETALETFASRATTQQALLPVMQRIRTLKLHSNDSQIHIGYALAVCGCL